MATITGGTTKKTRSTKAKVGGAAMPAELRKTISEISDADLTYILGGVLYNDLMLK